MKNKITIEIEEDDSVIPLNITRIKVNDQLISTVQKLELAAEANTPLPRIALTIVNPDSIVNHDSIITNNDLYHNIKNCINLLSRFKCVKIIKQDI